MVLADCWTENLILAGYWLEATLSSWPCGSFPGEAYNMAGDFIKISQRRGELEEIEGMVFHNLISEVPSYHLCCTLFIRNKSLSPAHTKGKNYTRHISWMWRPPGAILEVIHHGNAECANLQIGSLSLLVFFLLLLLFLLAMLISCNTEVLHIFH